MADTQNRERTIRPQASKGVRKPLSASSSRALMERKPQLSSAELSVLRVFRRYLLTPGVMLCFYGKELKDMKSSLRQLTARGYLVGERFPGAYSLTEDGFAQMQAAK